MTSDPRMGRLEAEVGQIGQRVAGVEGEVRQMGEWLGSLENTMNSRFSDVNTHLGDINARLTSLEGRVTTMWVTTMGTIVAGVIALVVERLLNS